MDFEFELYKGKKYSDLLEDIVKVAQIASKAAMPAAGDSGFNEKDLELLFGDIQKSVMPLPEAEIKELPNIEK